MKANTSLSGPNDAVEKPRGSTKLDWEVEIAAIIGTRAKYVSEADALNHVAGYCVCNDVSERYFQIERARPVDQGQVARHLRPGRPVARHQGRDPRRAEALDVARRQRQALPDRIDLDHDLLDGEVHFHVSQFLTLLPGDIITTGTPPGVGAGMKPPQFLNVGDVVTLGIEGLGEQRQEIIAA